MKVVCTQTYTTTFHEPKYIEKKHNSNKNIDKIKSNGNNASNNSAINNENNNKNKKQTMKHTDEINELNSSTGLYSQ